MNAQEITQGLHDLNRTEKQLDEACWECIAFVARRLPHMALKEQPYRSSQRHFLRLMKRQLKQFDSTTGKWRR